MHITGENVSVLWSWPWGESVTCDCTMERLLCVCVCVSEYYCKNTSQKWNGLVISHPWVLTQPSLFQQSCKSGCEVRHAHMPQQLSLHVSSVWVEKKTVNSVYTSTRPGTQQTCRIYSFSFFGNLPPVIFVWLPRQVFNHWMVSFSGLPVCHPNSAEKRWTHGHVLLALTFYRHPHYACFYSVLRNQTVTL